MKKYTKEEKQFGLPEQDQVMNKYKTLGFVKDKRDEQGLHMAFSPQRVPTGLTKLQVRRRIEKYYRYTRDIEDIFGNHRMTILMDGKFFSGTSFSGKVPENSKQFLKLLKELVSMMEAPTVPDPEVLGKYSPK